MILHGIRWECHVNQGSPRYIDPNGGGDPGERPFVEAVDALDVTDWSDAWDAIFTSEKAMSGIEAMLMSQRCREEFLSLLGECFGESAEEYATNVKDDAREDC